MSTLDPYDYQKDALRFLSNVRRKGKDRALVVMASGLGKTVLAAFEVKRYLDRYGGRVLYVCHQNEILEQAYSTFEEVLGAKYSFGYLHGGQKDTHPVDVLFASFQSMHNDWREEFSVEWFTYIIVDESHHSWAETYYATIQYFEPKFLLGLTATPERTDLQSLSDIYGDEQFTLLLEDALAQGLLAPVDYRLMTDELQNLDVLQTPVGRLSIAQLNRSLFIPRRDDEILRIIGEKALELDRPRVMIFAPSISYCNRLSNLSPDIVAIHSGLPDKDRIERLSAFRSGEVNAIVTVDVFNEGIDVPDVNLIVFLRSTASRIVFFQQLGRGLRLSPGKNKVLVLDFVANCERLETVHRLWSDVQERAEQIHRQKKVHDKPIIVNEGEFVFDEVVMGVLNVIENVRRGYTRTWIVGYLRRIYAQVQRPVTAKDIETFMVNEGGPSLNTILSYFEGSLIRALQAAGLPVNAVPRNVTNEELLGMLVELASQLGRTPTQEDVKEMSGSGTVAHPSTYLKRFGTFTDAIKKAGLPIVKRPPYEKDELTDVLKRVAEDNAGNITVSQYLRLVKAQGLPSLNVIYRKFGSFEDALKAAGLPAQTSRYTEEQILEFLVELTESLGRLPKSKDIKEASRGANVPSYTTIISRFGNLELALKVAKLV